MIRSIDLDINLTKQHRLAASVLAALLLASCGAPVFDSDVTTPPSRRKTTSENPTETNRDTDPDTDPETDPDTYDPGTPGETTPMEEESSQASDAKRGALAGIVTPGFVTQTTETGINYGLHALYCASYYNGGQQLISTGTLTLNGPGALPCPANGLAFSYSSAPSDRLVVKGFSEQSFEVKVHDLRGNLIEGPEQFTDGNHRLDMELAVPGKSDVRIVSVGAGRTRTIDITGYAVQSDGRYDVTLQRVGDSSFESDSSGGHFTDRFTVTGQVRGPGVEATVNESWDYEQVCGERNRRRGFRCASSFKRRFSNQWVIDGVTYVLQDGAANASFLDGKPNSSELMSFWMARGTLLADGAPIGRIAFEPDPTGALLHFYLVVGSERVSLQSWHTHTTGD